MAMPASAQQRDVQVRPNIQRDLADGRLPDRDTLNRKTVTIVTAPVGGAFAANGLGHRCDRVRKDGISCSKYRETDAIDSEYDLHIVARREITSITIFKERRFFLNEIWAISQYAICSIG
jgi:hypothetical protein